MFYRCLMQALLVTAVLGWAAWNTARADVIDVHLAAKYVLFQDYPYEMRTRHLGIGYAKNVVDNMRLNAGFWEASTGGTAYYATVQGYTRPRNAKWFTEFGIDMGYRSEYASDKPVSFSLYTRVKDMVKVSILPLYTVAQSSTDDIGGAVIALSLSFGE